MMCGGLVTSSLLHRHSSTAHQAAAAGGWQPWAGPPGAGAVRRGAGTLQIQTLETGDWVKARVLSPVSADCQLLLSGFIILEIMHRHAAGGGAQAWPAGWRDYCIRKKPALGQRERGCPCPPAAKLVTKPPPAALI